MHTQTEILRVTYNGHVMILQDIPKNQKHKIKTQKRNS